MDQSLISARIDELSFPGIRKSIIIQLVLFISFQCIEIPVMLILSTVFRSQMTAPLDFFSTQALLLSEGFVVQSLSQQYVYTHMNEPPSVTPIPTPPQLVDPPPDAIGGKWEIDEQMNFWLRKLALSIQEVSTFRSFQTDSPHLLFAQQSLFATDLNVFYYEGGVPFGAKVSVPIALVNVMGTQSELIQMDHFTTDILRDAVFLNPSCNVPIIAPAIRLSLSALVSYVTTLRDELSFITQVIGYVSMVIAAILFLGSQVIESMWVRGNKERVYTSLISIPKNHLTAMVENLHLGQADHEDGPSTGNTESNKHEDNIVKAFLAGGGSVISRIMDQMVMIISMVINLALYMTCQILMQDLILGHGTSVSEAAPHMIYLHASWGGMVAALTDFLQACFIDSPNANPLWRGDKAGITRSMRGNLDSALEMYHAARRGDPTTGLPPYSGYLEGSMRATDIVFKNCNDSGYPEILSDALMCWSPDMVFEATEGILGKYLQGFSEMASWKQVPFDPVLQELWSLLMHPLYDLLLEPMYSEIIGVINNGLSETDNRMYPVIVILVVVAIICQTTSLLNIAGIETHMRNVLHLLQHCPASVLMQTPRVMAVLNGDFSTKRRDESARNVAFFEGIVEQMPEAVVICAETMIKSSNAACERIFGERFTGMSIADLLRDKMDGDVGLLISPTGDVQGKFIPLVFRKNSEDVVNLEVSIMPMADARVYVFRDVTQTVGYNAIIDGERSKSDRLLQSILPPSLVPKVRAGEKNISFAVTSVSIVFVDIVGFTPWCRSYPANEIMSTLNNLFNRFDANCNSYPLMTRVKSIGDCYMGAGGVFAEINQPAEHAKQVVSFGLDCIDSIIDMNRQLNENLQIRVGVNTGGPIVAGVLGGIGAGRPTFEILGPPINIAQQMEHHGVPMNVHISRAVYEIIYGGEFKVVERGTVKTAMGDVVTYLVTGRTAPRTKS